MVEWLCKRCATKLKKSIEPEPMVLRRCTGCDVENYCYPAGHAGEDAEPEKAAEIARSQAAVHGKTEGEREVAESNPGFKGVPDEIVKEMGKVIDEIQSEDADVSEEVVPAAEPPTDGDANTTDDTEAQLRAQIAELEAKLKKE